MNFLVTGGAGFIGSNLTLELQNRFPGCSIVVVDELSPGNEENLDQFNGNLIKGQIEDGNLAQKLMDEHFDSIYHMAAITDTTVIDKKRMTTVNVDGFRNILRIAEKCRAPVVYASSAAVYGDGPVPMKESQQVKPLNAYAVSKVEMEKVASSFTASSIIGLRFFNVYGCRENHKSKAASMIHQLAEQMLGETRPRIFEFGEQSRDFIYVEDVVSAAITAMDTLKREKLNTVINVGTGIAVDFNTVIEILNKILGTDYEPEYFPNPYDFYQNVTQADISLAKQITGFEARYTVEEGINHYLKTGFGLPQ